MYRYRMEYLKDRQSHSLLVKEHEEIVQGLTERDADRALRVQQTATSSGREITLSSSCSISEREEAKRQEKVKRQEKAKRQKVKGYSERGILFFVVSIFRKVKGNIW